MSPENKEPERLRKGKSFHKRIQKEWHDETKNVETEKPMTKPSGRKGRMDIFIKGDKTDERLVAVVEIKASDWDAMTLGAVQRNVRRQVRQIWDYIESHLAGERCVAKSHISYTSQRS